MHKSLINIFLIVIITLSSCAQFIPKENKPIIEELEKKTYIIKNQTEVGDETLKKGERVKIRIFQSKSWIKVYAFSLKEDPLKAKLILVLYLFDEDFKKKKFDFDFFKSKLFEKVTEIK